jgi:hypothetical protein
MVDRLFGTGGAHAVEEVRAFARRADARGVLSKSAARAENSKSGSLRRNEGMVKSVEGIYRNGRVDLMEPISEAEGSHVDRDLDPAGDTGRPICVAG